VAYLNDNIRHCGVNDCSVRYLQQHVVITLPNSAQEDRGFHTILLWIEFLKRIASASALLSLAS
jgi:hypothetical protein